MWPFTRHQVSPKSEIAKRTAENSLQQAQAHQPVAETKLTDSHQVREQLQAHNRACGNGDLIESLVLSRLAG